MIKAELALKAESIIGEGSLWDWEQNRLLWVDIWQGEIHSFDPASGLDTLIFKSSQTMGTVVQREGGGLVAAMGNGFHFIDEQGRATQICNPEADLPENRFNDGKCDPAGRFWAGTMQIDTAPAGTGSLYRLGKDLSCVRMENNVSISNGIIWSPDGRTMYYTDSPTLEVWAYDFDVETGGISNRRTVVRIPEGEGVPDGMTLDSEGMLWIAQWGGGQVSRYDPRTGRKLGQVDVPASQASSCAFGGVNLDELYITTARNTLSTEQLQKEPLAGSLFVAKVGVKGLKAEKFKG